MVPGNGFGQKEGTYHIRLTFLPDEAELEARRADFRPLPPRYERGVLAKYARLVGSASRGAVCD